MSSRSGWVAATIVLALVLGAGACVGERRFVVTRLAPLPGDPASSAFGISPHGVAVGRSGPVVALPTSRVSFTPVVWGRDGTPEALPIPPDDTGGMALALSPHGEIAGVSTGLFGGTRSAVVWDRDGNLTTLPPLFGPLSTSVAYGINPSGEAVGYSSFFGGRSPVVWDVHGTPVALPLLPGDTSGWAFGINAHGAVVGVSGIPSPRPGGSTMSPVVWSRDGAPTALPLLPGDATCVAQGINPSGKIVGSCGLDVMFGITLSKPVVWDHDDTPTALRLLPEDTTGAALAINPHGEIVGSSGVFDKPVMWDRDGTPTALPLLPGDTRGVASAINSHGEIVGTSGVSAVIWRPVAGH